VTTAAGRQRRSNDLTSHQRTAQVLAVDPGRSTRIAATGGVRTPLTIEAAAERLGVTPRMVRRLVNERRIGFVRVGKFIRLRPDDLDAYLDQHFQPPRPFER
jgi:excisionase family DNA binding protein